MQATMTTTGAGEHKAWEILAASDPADVCARAGVAWDPGRAAYLVSSFGRGFLVHPGERRILNLEPDGEVFVARHAGLFPLAVLWYLVRAAPARPSGRLVQPGALPGGGIFLHGTHVLPLDELAAAYGARPDAFLAAGAALGGRAVGYGDAAVELPALPRIPTTVLLWTADDEFPARADLLFDETAPRHAPTDILWSIAMLSVQSLI
jgi:hypothetical protein